MINATPASTHFDVGSFVKSVPRNTYVGPRNVVWYTGQSYDVSLWRRYPTLDGSHVGCTSTAFQSKKQQRGVG